MMNDTFNLDAVTVIDFPPYQSVLRTIQEYIKEKRLNDIDSKYKIDIK